MPLPISFPNPFADEDTVDADMMNALAAYLENIAVVAVPPSAVYRGTMFHDESVVLNGNSIALFYDSWGSPTTFEGVFARQDASALNDEFKNGLYLAADTYTFQSVALKNSSSGIVTWYLDDVSIGTSDLYAASETQTTETISSLALGNAGWHTLRGKLESKNGSSSGYDCNIFKMAMIGSLA